ncbi:Target of rapamycin complex 1 subunit kog1 [Tilletia horrida]|nr:Target of rapamycin complex 1 subunit kog1 [Tilletia horrida]
MAHLAELFSQQQQQQQQQQQRQQQQRQPSYANQYTAEPATSNATASTSAAAMASPNGNRRHPSAGGDAYQIPITTPTTSTTLTAQDASAYFDLRQQMPGVTALDVAINGSGPSTGAEGVHLGDAVNDEEEEDELGELDIDDDELSTTSGKRHGALLDPHSEADWRLLEAVYVMSWRQRRHLTNGNPKHIDTRDEPYWRLRNRNRTVIGALMLCLNLSVTPPGVVKTDPCAKMITWTDPTAMEPSKVVNIIGKNLVAQFEILTSSAKFKIQVDPVIEEMKKFCLGLRRYAKDERVLFYYNGYGVPKPTPGGEIWVFNKIYTQYIPVTLVNLQSWLGNPCIYIWDAHSAGSIVATFNQLNGRDENGNSLNASPSLDGSRSDRSHSASDGASRPEKEGPQFSWKESIHLAACRPDETLPMNPDLPADMFTCCLTSPIDMVLRWFVLTNNSLPRQVDVDMVMNIPGRLQDRRSPLGELQWIFISVTDAIAWSVLPRQLFRRLFRADLAVAALMRNFLLAERLMRFYDCTPMSYPKIAETHKHPLWDTFDLTIDQCLAQLPMLIAKKNAMAEQERGGPPMDARLAAFEYKRSTFFSEQLQAFDLWLTHAGLSKRGRAQRLKRSEARAASATAGSSLSGYTFSTSFMRAPTLSGSSAQSVVDDDEPPELFAREAPLQLPIVLQVLLSQEHRVRALILFSQFFDLGPWAVELCLTLGIFPYAVKLLQSPAADLKPVLIYIWARIMAVDSTCRADLHRATGYYYFSSVLSPHGTGAVGGAPGASVYGSHGSVYPNTAAFFMPNPSEHRAMCAFVLAVYCQNFPEGQEALLLNTDAMDACLEHTDDDDFLLRQWSVLCLAEMWNEYDAAKAKAIQKDAHGKLCSMLCDISVEVRSAVLYALGTLLGASSASANGTIPPEMSGHGKDEDDPLFNRPHSASLGNMTGLDESQQRSIEIGIATAMLATKNDCSPLVRKELCIALSPIVWQFRGFLVLAAFLYYDREESMRRTRAASAALYQGSASASSVSMGPASGRSGVITAAALASAESASETRTQEREAELLRRVLSRLAMDEGITETDIADVPAFMTLFVSLLDLSVDSHPEVAAHGSTLLDYVMRAMVQSEVARVAEHSVKDFGGGVDAISRVVTPTSTKDDFWGGAGYAFGGTSSGSAAGPSSLSRSVSGSISSSSSGFFRTTPDGSATVWSGSGNRHSVEGLTSLIAQELHRPLDHVKVGDALAGLIAVDLRRYRARVSSDPNAQADSHGGGGAAGTGSGKGRAHGHHHGLGGSAGSTPMPSPSSRFSRSSTTEAESDGTSSTGGGGSGGEGRMLPLQSRIFEWFSDYFREPQMREENEEPGSVKFTLMTWKRQRNERLMADAGRLVEYATGDHKWKDTLPTLRDASTPYLLRFHPFEKHLLSCSEQDTVSIWDWEENRLVSRFNNGNPALSNITSAAFANAELDTVLLLGSADGEVRIWRNYERDYLTSGGAGPEVVSSFRALPDLIRSRKPSGLVIDWQMLTKVVLAGGDSRVIRAWDTHKELCICDIPTHTSACVSSISSDSTVGHIFVAGFGDGTVGVYDRRNPPKASLVRLWEEHQTWVQTVRLQRYGTRELVSTSMDGEVRLWDIRGRRSIAQSNISAPLKGRLSCAVVHDWAPVMAFTSQARLTKPGLLSYNVMIANLNHLDPTSKRMQVFSRSINVAGPSQHSSGTSSISGGGIFDDAAPSAYTPAMGAIDFHPHLPLLAYSAAPDRGIEFRKCEEPPPEEPEVRIPPLTPLVDESLSNGGRSGWHW